MESGTAWPTARPMAGALTIALAVCLLLAGAAATSGAPAPAEPPKTDAELARLRDFLVGTDRTLGTRRDAAEVLLEKDTAPARAILVDVMSGPTPSEATLAILDAIAGRESAADAYVEPLFQLLRSDDEPTRRAAALAFGAYQAGGKVLARLKDLATAAEGPLPGRLAAIQALSQIMDKRSIEALARLAADPKPAVAAAAAEALDNITGLKALGTSREAWADWWKKHEQDPESVLLAGLLRRCREEMKRREAAADRLQARLIRQLTETYDAADAKEKGRLALAHLEDAVPQVRALAARQAAGLARDALAAGNGAARQPYQELIASILKHVNDESPAVRAAAAEALAAWKEASAAPVLLSRLDAEKVPEARAALAAALGGLRVAEAVPKLVAMLDSPNEVEVLRAAGALGAIGEKGAPSAAPVEGALKALGRLARSAQQPPVREAACLALARIAHPSVEGVLVAALEDPAASVRFSAAQGLGNLAKVSDRTVAALLARLQDENKGVRQAVAAALAKLGGPDAARKIADRLKVGAETEPAVRNALWAAVKTLVDRGGSPDLAQELGDRFFSREGAEEMQHAAAMYEAALGKLQPAARSGAAGQALYEKLVDASIASGTPDAAVPALRQLLAITAPANAARIRELNQQLGRILLAKEPGGEAMPHLAAAMKGATPEDRLALAKAVQARAEMLVKAEKCDQAAELIDAFGRAVPDFGGTDLTDALKQLRGQAEDAAVAQAIAKLSGTDEQAAVATAAIKKIGRPAVPKLLDALESAAKDRRATVEAKVLATIEAITGSKESGYDLQAPLEERVKKIAGMRQAP